MLSGKYWTISCMGMVLILVVACQGVSGGTPSITPSSTHSPIISPLPTVRMTMTPYCTSTTTPMSLLMTATPAAKVSPPGRILFTREYLGLRGDGPPNIYVMNADGSDQMLVARQGRHARWSPDGQWIAFECLRDGNWDVCIVGADGSGERQLTHDSMCESDIAWSPNGQIIAFVKANGVLDCIMLDSDSRDIYTVNMDGTVQTNLTDTSNCSEYFPSWSPDGRHILFVRRMLSEENPYIYVMETDGSNLMRITECRERCGWPGWSPDGQRISYATTLGEELSGLRIVDVSGTILIEIPHGERLSPNWQQVVAIDGVHLYTSQIDGSGIHQIVDLSKIVSLNWGWDLSWSPDGQWLAFTADFKIYVARSDGTQLLQLTRWESDTVYNKFCEPVWSPEQ